MIDEFWLCCVWITALILLSDKHSYAHFAIRVRSKLASVQQQCVIGVDFGGTNVRACAYGTDGIAVGEKSEDKSKAQDGIPNTLNAVAGAINAAATSARENKYEVVSAGISLPGHIENSTGFVRWAPNLGHFDEKNQFIYWKDVQVRDPLSEKTGLKIVMGNDANLAAMGEYIYGSGKGNANCLVMLTLGTGLGGGVVLGPRSVLGKAEGPLVLLGGNQGGVELGHTTVMFGGQDCNAGTYGALEAYTQKDSISRRAVHRLKRDYPSILGDWVTVDGVPNYDLVDPELISKAAEQGDELAIEVFQEVGQWLGVGIGSYINIFAPDIMAIGGNIAKAGKYLMEPAIKTARNVAIVSLFKDCKIIQAEKLEDAGILGGAALAWQSLAWN